MPSPTNGGFKNQEEFRKFVFEHQTGKFNSEFTARPSDERVPDYVDNSIGDAFPLQFPFGYTGLKGDPAVKELKIKPYGKRFDVFWKLL
jgi:hypothetical protein